MKFMMIFEGVDRATRVMNKIMSAEKKTAASVKAGANAAEAATKGATKATEKQASVLSRLGGAARTGFRAVVEGARASGRAVATLHRQTLRLGKAGIGQIKAGAQRAMGGLVVGASVATAAFGTAALAANHLLDTATAFESYRIQLETLEGSSAKGKAAMDWITDFAVKTPLELDQVVESYRTMKTFGLDPTNGSLQALVDTMAASGKGVEHLDGLILAMGQAWTKEKLQGEEALQLLERGVPVWEILSQKYGKTAAQLQEMASKGQLGRDAIQALMDEIGRRNAGASEKMSQTWEGMIGNLSDTWLQFKLAIMDAGLFDWMKGKLKFLLDTVKQMEADGSLQQWATYISDKIKMVLVAAWQFATGTYAVLKKLGGYLSIAAKHVGGWENLAMILAGFAFAPVLVSTAAGIVQIAVGLTMLGVAGTGILLGVAAIAGGAILIYRNWEAIAGFFAGLWRSISNGVSTAYAAVAEWLGFDPLAVLSAGWSMLSNVFSAVWQGLPSLEWNDLIPAFSWSNFLVVLDWLSWLSPLRWLDFVPGFSWAGVIRGALDWAKYVAGLRWSDFVSALSWGSVLTALNWLSWLSPLRWLDFVPGFSWEGVISGALDWGRYIVSFEWSKYLPSFSWPELPSFSWPELPSLMLPELPDIAGAVTALGGKAMAAIETVGAKLGSAWSSVKSAFSFGGQAADVTVTDPASILAAAEATAKLNADMQAVAAVDTGPAMAQLKMLEKAVKSIVPTVTGAVTAAQTYLSGVSFYDKGAALMETMAAGMRARAAVVVQEIKAMTQTIRDHLPSSPAKVGPLSDIHRLKFGETIAGSIRAEPMVRAMRAAATATMAAAAISMPPIEAPAVAMPATAATSAEAARAEVARASLQSTTPSGGGAPTINFSATVNVPASAGSSPADIKTAVQDALRESMRELAAMLAEEERRKGRREF